MTMFLAVRIILCFFLLMLLFAFGIKFSFRKRYYIISSLCVIILYVFLYYSPFENIFFSFDSPKDAFEYAGKGDVVAVIPGDETEIVLYQTSDTAASTIPVRKDNGKYKICRVISQKVLQKAYFDSYSIRVIKIKNTSDCYIEIYGVVDDDNISIEDTNSKLFTPIYESSISGTSKKIVRFVEYIEYSENYKISINGNTINWD